MVCTAVFIGLLLVTQGWLQIPVLLALGFTSLALTPPMMAAVQESYPENRALSNGIYMAVNFAGSAIGALVIGILADAYSMQFAYIFSAVMVVIGLPFLWLLPNKKRVA
jgi:FSR family fosmidomycin resistance protein-like MFS transporter